MPVLFCDWHISGWYYSSRINKTKPTHTDELSSPTLTSITCGDRAIPPFQLPPFLMGGVGGLPPRSRSARLPLTYLEYMIRITHPVFKNKTLLVKSRKYGREYQIWGFRFFSLAKLPFTLLRHTSQESGFSKFPTGEGGGETIHMCVLLYFIDPRVEKIDAILGCTCRKGAFFIYIYYMCIYTYLCTYTCM